MGVDASYLYGYMAKKEDVIWDIEFLKEKFNLNENLTGWLKEYTYKDLVEWLENDDIDDWDDLVEIMGIKSKFVYDEDYLYFTHFEVANKYAQLQLGDLNELAKEYAKESGVMNSEIFKWKEFGYFD